MDHGKSGSFQRHISADDGTVISISAAWGRACLAPQESIPELEEKPITEERLHQLTEMLCLRAYTVPMDANDPLMRAFLINTVMNHRNHLLPEVPEAMNLDDTDEVVLQKHRQWVKAKQYIATKTAGDFGLQILGFRSTETDTVTPDENTESAYVCLELTTGSIWANSLLDGELSQFITALRG